MKYVIWMAIALTATISCKRDDDGKHNSLPNDKQILTDQVYGQDERHKMDVYLPGNRSPQMPFIVLIHGGGWMGGDKKDLNAVQQILLDNNIASISMNYRYVNNNIHYNELMEDVGAAVKYIVNNAGDWNTRTTGFGMLGHSAGAHIALLYGYKYDADNRISSITSVAGPTDFTINDFHLYAGLIGLSQNLNNLAGATFELLKPIPEAFVEASPIAHIINKPTFIIHGDADLVVPYDQAIRLRDRLQSKGYTYKFHVTPGANHDAGFADEATAAALYQSILEWIRKYS